MPAYRAEGFDPPAPVALATVRGPTGLAQLDVPLLLDTGSDVSIVPRSVASAVGAPIFTPAMHLEFYDGSGVPTQAAILAVELLRFTFEGEFIVADRAYGVLGRNILNNLTVAFDGPNLTWSA